MYKKISGFSDEISEKVTEQFAVLNKLGISYFEPRGIDGKNISGLSTEDVLQLKKQMERFGISASSIGSPIGKIKLEEDFEEHFILFQKVVWIAKELGITRVALFYKINNLSEFKISEVRKLTKILRLSNKMMETIFYRSSEFNTPLCSVLKKRKTSRRYYSL